MEKIILVIIAILVIVIMIAIDLYNEVLKHRKAITDGNKKESSKITTEDIFSKHFIEDLDKITVNIERATKSLNQRKYEYIVLDTTNEMLTFMIFEKIREGYEICGAMTPYKNEKGSGVLIPMRK